MVKFAPKLDEEQVRKLAELAHLTLTDEERAGFTGQLEEILGYAERIQALDTEGVSPTSHALLEAGLEAGLEKSSALRDDEPTESLNREKVLEGAPDPGADLFKVPKVLR
ncbi:MAG: Asp-tRNA(Asn)/Glu-tRNA(Gln) amidotransferase subunit GatC [Acidobacteriota bacterium]|nr:MAG: Asp-tRNA(Asn)/Glu-tRNA(Gln) amidotransferase subunit GatC [Acidobacteriota bacterium]